MLSSPAEFSMCVSFWSAGKMVLRMSHKQGYHGAAVGKGRQLAKTELEKLKLSELTARQAVFEAARMYVFYYLAVD